MDLSNVKSFFEYGSKEGPIRCIFFCEFHPTAGPIISCQVSYGYKQINCHYFIMFIIVVTIL